MRVSRWGLAAVALAVLTGPAVAHLSKNCRPYTIEKVCGESGRACHLHMVYAPGHNPAGRVPDGYWYSAKPRHAAHKSTKHRVKHRKAHHSVFATCRSLSCWYRHDPEHRY